MINISKQISEGYPYPPIRETINGKDVSITGFLDSEEFFEDNRHFFESAVSEHDVIVLEGIKGTEFWGHGEFYGLVGAIAHSQNKRVYQVDLVNWSVWGLDYALLGLGAWLIRSTTPKIVESEVSRKDLLKFLVGWPVGASLIAGSTPGVALRWLLNTESVIGFGIDDLLFYGKIDYKNIGIAAGIDRLCHEVDGFDSLVALHGYAHYETVVGYLRNPDLRLKRLAYLPYDLVGNTNIREYVPYEDGWVRVREF